MYLLIYCFAYCFRICGEWINAHVEYKEFSLFFNPVWHLYLDISCQSYRKLSFWTNVFLGTAFYINMKYIFFVKFEKKTLSISFTRDVDSLKMTSKGMLLFYQQQKSNLQGYIYVLNLFKMKFITILTTKQLCKCLHFQKCLDL